MGLLQINSDFYRLLIINLINSPTTPNDYYSVVRDGIFIKLLCYCASGMTFSDYSQFSKITMSPEKQSKIVWDICINENVLREEKGGYSTTEWMIENELFAETGKTSKCAITEKFRPSRLEPPNDTANTEQTQQEQTSVKLDGNPEQDAQRNIPSFENNGNIVNVKEIKERVRPNVYLSRKELKELQSEFSDEQMAKMLDKLSEYKIQNKRNYVSDYDAIRRWVINWLDSSQNVSKNNSSVEFPDWLTGK